MYMFVGIVGYTFEAPEGVVGDFGGVGFESGVRRLFGDTVIQFDFDGGRIQLKLNTAFILFCFLDWIKTRMTCHKF